MPASIGYDQAKGFFGGVAAGPAQEGTDRHDALPRQARGAFFLMPIHGDS
jgi:hypothetical protein